MQPRAPAAGKGCWEGVLLSSHLRNPRSAQGFHSSVDTDIVPTEYFLHRNPRGKQAREAIVPALAHAPRPPPHSRVCKTPGQWMEVWTQPRDPGLATTSQCELGGPLPLSEPPFCHLKKIWRGGAHHAHLTHHQVVGR